MRFYTTATNSRKRSIGIGGGAKNQEVHTRGWTSGVRVVAKPHPTDKRLDVFDLYMTYGSNGGLPDEFIGTVTRGFFGLKLVKEKKKK